MTNIESLRKIIKEEMINDQEALEFLDALEEDLQNKSDEIKKLKEEISDWENGEMESDKEEQLDLGLDTIFFSFEKGNLLIREKFDHAMQKIQTTKHAEILF